MVDPRLALRSLKDAEPILVQESLPFGADNMETFPMPAVELDSMAERFVEPIPEEPNMEDEAPRVALLYVHFCFFWGSKMSIKVD